MGTVARLIMSSVTARYLTSDPTISLSTVRDGRPVYDFAAAPSLFLEEDLRQETEMLKYREATCAALKQAECDEAAAVAHRQKCEADAAAALANERQKASIAAEAREIEVRAVEQRAAIEAAYADAEACARAAMERCKSCNTCSHLLPLNRSVHLQRALLLLPRRRSSPLRPVHVKHKLLIPAVPKIVHLLNVAHLKPRDTDSHTLLSRHSASVEATSSIRFNPNSLIKLAKYEEVVKKLHRRGHWEAAVLQPALESVQN